MQLHSVFREDLQEEQQNKYAHVVQKYNLNPQDIFVFEDNEIEDLLQIISSREKGLALYLFTRDISWAKETMQRMQYGGGCINDTIIHLATSEMGFGGVGESGMGSYHGKDGFDAFSHYKCIVDKKTWIDLPMRYHPYKSKFSEKLIKFFSNKSFNECNMLTFFR